MHPQLLCNIPDQPDTFGVAVRHMAARSASVHLCAMASGLL